MFNNSHNLIITIKKLDNFSNKLYSIGLNKRNNLLRINCNS